MDRESRSGFASKGKLAHAAGREFAILNRGRLRAMAIGVRQPAFGNGMMEP
jgi:hypothetical protein